MKNIFILINAFALGIICSLFVNAPVQAQQKPGEEKAIYTYNIKKDQSDDANELNTFLAEYIISLNAHNMEKMRDFYATNYISGDGFTKSQVIDLIKQTWEKCPDIKYSTNIKNLRLTDKTASVEFNEDINATTKDKSEITKDKGVVNGFSQNIIYLEKYGSGWKIVTDKTLYEETSVKYGSAKNINFTFDVPEQVTSGEDYTASLKIDLPSNIFALGSLASVPVTYPAKQFDESFKQFPPELSMLERVIKANKDNYNELSSASVCLCEAERLSYTSFDLKISGTAVILKRINVLPKQ